jgi:hypothetical protein
MRREQILRVHSTPAVASLSPAHPEADSYLRRMDFNIRLENNNKEGGTP